jgi:hypothetical protein
LVTALVKAAAVLLALNKSKSPVSAFFKNLFSLMLSYLHGLSIPIAIFLHFLPSLF